jgi:hypothetical protein
MNTTEDALRALAELAQLAMLPPPNNLERHQMALRLHAEILRALAPPESMRMWLQRQIGEALDLEAAAITGNVVNFMGAVRPVLARLKGEKPPAAVESPEAA